MDIEVANHTPPTSNSANEERVATVTAVDANTVTPTAMGRLRDIGSQVCFELF